MKRLLAATLGSVLLLTAGGAIATPPGPGKHFDCSDAGGATSCASDDTGCVPGSKDDPSAPNVAATLFADKTNPLSLDAQNGNVYCDSTMGAMLIDASGDDAGWVPHSGDQLKCADSVGKELGKLTAAVIKCHIKMADQFFAGKDFDENVCEENDPVKHKSAVEKYNAAMTK